MRLAVASPLLPIPPAKVQAHAQELAFPFNIPCPQKSTVAEGAHRQVLRGLRDAAPQPVEPGGRAAAEAGWSRAAARLRQGDGMGSAAMVTARWNGEVIAESYLKHR